MNKFVEDTQKQNQNFTSVLGVSLTVTSLEMAGSVSGIAFKCSRKIESLWEADIFGGFVTGTLTDLVFCLTLKKKLLYRKTSDVIIVKTIRLLQLILLILYMRKYVCLYVCCSITAKRIWNGMLMYVFYIYMGKR